MGFWSKKSKISTEEVVNYIINIIDKNIKNIMNHLINNDIIGFTKKPDEYVKSMLYFEIGSFILFRTGHYLANKNVKIEIGNIAYKIIMIALNKNIKEIDISEKQIEERIELYTSGSYAARGMRNGYDIFILSIYHTLYSLLLNIAKEENLFEIDNNIDSIPEYKNTNLLSEIEYMEKPILILLLKEIYNILKEGNLI
jgi:hypothetical protein